jgi:hypothetical protein
MVFFSCEIEDDFGHSDDTSFKSAIFLSVNASWIQWLDEENIIYWEGGSLEIKRVNAKTKASISLYTLKGLEPYEDFITALYFTDQNKLLTLIVRSDGTQYSTSLCLVNLGTDEITRLPGTVEFTGRNYFVINDTHLAYASPHDGVTDILLYDLNTGDIVFVGPGVPVALSPDGTSLLCQNDYSTYLYNLNSNTQGPAPVALAYYYYNTQVRWNEEGITEVNVVSNYPTVRIEVHNLTKNTFLTRSSVIASDKIYLSPSGHKIIHSNASCLSPYLKSCPTQEGRIALFMADIPSNDDIELFAEKVSIETQIYIDQLEFSPDENNIAFLQNGQLFISPD